MSDYTMAQAKRDFERGFLKGVEVRHWEIAGGVWTVMLESMGGSIGFLVDARTKRTREFKTVDAAVRAIQSMGFKIKTLVVG